MITGLDHANIRTARLDEMVAWYGEVLGLTAGWRPPSFDFPGAWLYAGDQAVVHLVGVAATEPPGSAVQLEHAAFAASGLRDFLARSCSGCSQTKCQRHLLADVTAGFAPQSLGQMAGLSVKELTI